MLIKWECNQGCNNVLGLRHVKTTNDSYLLCSLSQFIILTFNSDPESYRDDNQVTGI